MFSGSHDIFSLFIAILKFFEFLIYYVAALGSCAKVALAYNHVAVIGYPVLTYSAYCARAVQSRAHSLCACYSHSAIEYYFYNSFTQIIMHFMLFLFIMHTLKEAHKDFHQTSHLVNTTVQHNKEIVHALCKGIKLPFTLLMRCVMFVRAVVNNTYDILHSIDQSLEKIIHMLKDPTSFITSANKIVLSEDKPENKPEYKSKNLSKNESECKSENLSEIDSEYKLISEKSPAELTEQNPSVQLKIAPVALTLTINPDITKNSIAQNNFLKPKLTIRSETVKNNKGQEFNPLNINSLRKNSYSSQSDHLFCDPSMGETCMGGGRLVSQEKMSTFTINQLDSKEMAAPSTKPNIHLCGKITDKTKDNQHEETNFIAHVYDNFCRIMQNMQNDNAGSTLSIY